MKSFTEWQKISNIEGIIRSKTRKSGMPVLESMSDKTINKALIAEITGSILMKLFHPFFFLSHDTEQLTITLKI